MWTSSRSRPGWSAACPPRPEAHRPPGRAATAAEESLLIQFVSLVGAGLILVAYAAHQAGHIGRESLVYHALNAVGGLVLCIVAIAASQVGFIVLEGVWTVISLGAIVRSLRRRPSGV